MHGARRKRHTSVSTELCAASPVEVMIRAVNDAPMVIGRNRLWRYQPAPVLVDIAHTATSSPFDRKSLVCIGGRAPNVIGSSARPNYSPASVGLFFQRPWQERPRGQVLVCFCTVPTMTLALTTFCLIYREGFSPSNELAAGQLGRPSFAPFQRRNPPKRAELKLPRKDPSCRNMRRQGGSGYWLFGEP